jgi:hypothetical protein
MKNLNTLIEQQKERVINQCVTYPSDQTRSGKEVRLDPDYLAILTTQTATKAYRQALEDVLAGLPDDKEHLNYDSDERGHNTALQTVRAQIEGLLGKIE